MRSASKCCKVCRLSFRGGEEEVERRKRAVTASGKGQLKQLPMAKLKKYAKAYNIDVAGIIEKDEFINKLVATRVSTVCCCRCSASFPDVRLVLPLLQRTTRFSCSLKEGS